MTGTVELILGRRASAAGGRVQGEGGLTGSTGRGVCAGFTVDNGCGTVHTGVSAQVVCTDTACTVSC